MTVKRKDRLMFCYSGCMPIAIFEVLHGIIFLEGDGLLQTVLVDTEISPGHSKK